MTTRKDLWNQPLQMQGLPSELIPLASTIVEQLAAGVTEVELGECKCGTLYYDAKMRVADPKTNEPTSKQQIVEPASLAAIWLECDSPKGTRHISVVQVNRLKFPSVPEGTYMASWVRDGLGQAKRAGRGVSDNSSRGGHYETSLDDEPVEGNSNGQLSLGFFGADGTRLPKSFTLGKEAYIGVDNLVF